MLFRSRQVTIHLIDEAMTTGALQHKVFEVIEIITSTVCRWQKQLKEEQKLIALIQNHYKYNIVRAKEALRILSKEQIDIIIKKQEKGGLK